MFPDLIDLGFLHLKTYGACMATGFLLCWMLVEKLSGRKDLSNLLLSLMIFSLKEVAVQRLNRLAMPYPYFWLKK